MIEVKIKCPSRKEYIKMMKELFHSAIVTPNETIKKKIFFAFNEAVINAVEAMKKRYGDHHFETMTVELSLSETEIKIHVIDQGGGLTDEQQVELVNKTFYDAGLDASGRGFLFMREFMDELWCEKMGDHTFLVGMRKKLTD